MTTDSLGLIWLIISSNIVTHLIVEELRVATDHSIAVIVVVGINVELLELGLFSSLAWYLAITSSVQCSYVSRVH